MAVLDNVAPLTGFPTPSHYSMPVEDTTPLTIFPTMGIISSPYDASERLPAQPNMQNPDLVLGGDDTQAELTLGGNQTESPFVVEVQMITLDTWDKIIVFIIKGLLMGAVILTSLFGNLLVIVSVARYHKLRVITNYFVVSMALADMLVALMVMVFNASVQLTGAWIFGSLMCNIWNSMDVYFSTVSIFHLCCIAIDRYTAIVQPLDYPLRMTKRTVGFMLTVAWVSPMFISVLPIFLGWYTTTEQLKRMAADPGLCDFKVNLPYALVSSSMSFWIPGIIMLVMYYRIYREADRQEMMVFRNSVGQTGLEPRSRGGGIRHKTQSAIPALKRKLLNTRSTVAALLLNKHLHINGMAKESVKITDDSQIGKNGVPGPDEPRNPAAEPLQENALRPIVPGGEAPPSEDSTPSPTPGGTPKAPRSKGKRRLLGVGIRKSSGEATEMSAEEGATGHGKEVEKDRLEVPVVAHPPKKKSSSLNKMKRERKAAKTLGIIVSAFLLCWLPFFTWYLVHTLCGDSCHSPELLVTILFWIGYFNSTLNPIIYAYFNRDFRKAFRKTLKHYYGVCGCRACIRVCQKCCHCRTGCKIVQKICCCCCINSICSAVCPQLSRGDDETPSSEIPPRSGVSSDYVHIEMTTVEQKRMN